MLRPVRAKIRQEIFRQPIPRTRRDALFIPHPLGFP
jgi:hypothetical protein